MVYAGMDVGTSGCKLVAYDLEGNVVFSAARRYRETGTGGLRELDPAMVRGEVLDLLKETGEKCPYPIRALAVASLGESIVCLDKDGNPLMNAMLTGDSRGIPETARLIEKMGAQRIFEITGLPPNELYSLPKWIWMNENTDVFARTEKIFFFEDYVGWLLTGERKVSYSSAARSLAYDIAKNEWSAELLALAGLKPELFSQPAAPFTVIGTILPDVAAQLHLPEDLQIVVGGHDQSCAAFGSGLRGMATGECGMGTCEFMFLMLPEKMTTPYMRERDFTCIPYILPGTYLTSLEVTTCGILKNWARDTIFKAEMEESGKEGENFFARMDRLAQDVRTDVLVLPQFGSRGNPDLCMDARGTIAGLSIHTRPEEIYRAMLEGMALMNYLAYEQLLPLGTAMESIAATGGGASSALTLQIRADVFNMPVKALMNDEAGTLGCMMMAAVGTGAYKTPEEALERAVKVSRVYEPDEAMHAYYMEKYQRFGELYKRMFDFS